MNKSNKKTFLLCVVLLPVFVLSCRKAGNNVMPSKTHHDYVFNKAPLAQVPYAELPYGAIQPKGWLHVQLMRMANGLAGNLGKLYPDVGPNNAWRGGNGDSWERGPYYLNGLIALAYVLKDPKLINETKPWIEWTLNSQMSDGYFGPKPNPGVKDTTWKIQVANKADWWPRMLMLDALETYYEATKNPRVIPFMTKYFKYQLKTLPEKPLKYWTWWAEARGGENLASVYWLYNRTGDKFLLKLAPLIYKQTMDWTDGFLTGNLPSRHGVNVAMALKQPALYYQQTKNKKYLEASSKGLNDLIKNDGVVQGVFTADEMLHGRNPTHGTELCTVVETMFSLETLLHITGAVHYADQLEKVAYNALPAQITAAYSGRQYFQEANQIKISKGDRNFTTYYTNAVCYGLLTGYPCCTVNMHQGWPKFVQDLWLASKDNGLAALIYGPSEVTAKVADGVPVSIDEQTNYPFSSTITFVIHTKKPVSFPLHLRIPGWEDLASVQINGGSTMNYKGDQIIGIARNWKDGDKVVLTLPMKIKTSRWYQNSMGIQRGPLVYALKIPGTWKKLGEKDDVPVWGVSPDTPWNYGLVINRKDIASSFKFEDKKQMPDYPWTADNVPVSIMAKGVQIPGWKEYDNYAGPLPYSPVVVPKENVQNIELIPYGSTTLRIAEFPVIQ